MASSSCHSKFQYPLASSRRELILSQIHNHVKTDKTLFEYTRIFLMYCDELAAVGRGLSDRQKVFSLLRGLGSDYGPFVTTMLKPPIPTFGELLPLLQAYEAVKFPHSVTTICPNPNKALNKEHRGRPRKARVPPTSKGSKKPMKAGVWGDTSRSIRPCPSMQCGEEKGVECQICGMPNHTAINCQYVYNQTGQFENFVQFHNAPRFAPEERGILGERPHKGVEKSEFSVKFGRVSQSWDNHRNLDLTGWVPSDQTCQPKEDAAEKSDIAWNFAGGDGTTWYLDAAASAHQVTSDPGSLCEIRGIVDHSVIRCWRPFNPTSHWPQDAATLEGHAASNVAETEDTMWFINTLDSSSVGPTANEEA